MADQSARSFGPFAVGMMALHDREFFERLLKNPRETLTDHALRRKLKLTDADIDAVVKLFEAAKPSLSAQEGLAAWDRWKATGEVGEGGGGWPTRMPGWPSWGVVRPER